MRWLSGPVTLLLLDFLSFFLSKVTGLVIEWFILPVMGTPSRPLELPAPPGNLSNYAVELGHGLVNLFNLLESTLVIISKSHKKRSYPLTQLLDFKKIILRELIQKKSKIHIHRVLRCLFSRATKNKQFKCPTVSEWLAKLRSNEYLSEYYMTPKMTIIITTWQYGKKI